ncbi:methylated-DNA--[protein]-cysteine S-methyltransferase [Patulibacter defluvii]|uniref:methylated-DNA--[protein]-cysteine S-methyltransferase n=1 Tax=Patulibacter defluvii TaxID=3095358 RepID=UPI002A75F2BD|nr:methylated-DNA--[protein]-cysteine S-methyltransferase [Patulibacter sp. DM4]
MPWFTYDSPLGPLTLVGDDGGLGHLHYPRQRPPLDPADEDPAAFTATGAALDRWFAGATRTIDVPLALAGTPLQRRVWALVAAIPYGTTTTYGALAAALPELRRDDPTPTPAQRVAWAIARTPTPILLPCHRVIGADGRLRGYLGGLDRKRALLRFEAAGGDPRALRDDGGRATNGVQQQLALV